ncbi:MAG: 2-C-methyl-D-erythritol 2,4-cyclodiphosphate synthase [Bacteroidales bacterium]
MDIRIGNGYDVHALAKGLPLWICGILIDHRKGCVAHSDGDTPIHALCDALLGALALGDIGKYFPDTSMEFIGIDSKILLSRVYTMIKEKGYTLVNADITIALQSPKIAPHIPQMRSILASILEVEADRISIKATTTEKLGFVGREEGIAAYAVVLVGR